MYQHEETGERISAADVWRVFMHETARHYSLEELAETTFADQFANFCEAYGYSTIND